jgi:hypothetical protein
MLSSIAVVHADPLPIMQLAVGLLSVPLLATAAAWLARRSTKESRLLIRVERLAAIYADLPTGEPKDEFGLRVFDATRELNTRLDPLFRSERRRKRKVALWVGGVLLALQVTVIPLISGTWTPPNWYGITSGLIGGAVIVVAWALIERDTKRQRRALRPVTSG